VRERNARFKKLNDDSKILGIGSLFRSVGRKTWAINVDFNGGLSQSLQFSNIPVLARKRVLNPTKQYDLAGLPISFSIENAKTWEVSTTSECPAYQAHNHGRDTNQLCFVTSVGSTKVFVPQLELARALFFHDPFLARLSLLHNALAEDFITGSGEEGKPLIVVREGAEYPVSYFNRDDNRRFLSWVLLDKSARTSFESISAHLIRSQYGRNSYQYWNFQFEPPNLSRVELEARGWEDRASNTFFVWEVIKLNKLPSDIEGEIDFFHPRYERKVGGKPAMGDGKKGEMPEQIDIDDEEVSASDQATIALMSDKVVVSFNQPHITNRIPSKTRAVKNIIDDGEKEVLDKDLSPNEKEESGKLPGGAWNNLDDQTDDAHLYVGKFESFYDMVQSLVVNHDFKVVRKELAKLPKIGKGQKHCLADTQNPRCLAIVELEFNNKSYILLEIDTSDGAAKLSTMLLKAPPDWVGKNEKKLLRQIMKKSLGWPYDYFKDQLGEKLYTGIPHPKSKHSGAFPSEVIDPWAQRIVNWIERTK